MEGIDFNKSALSLMLKLMDRRIKEIKPVISVESGKKGASTYSITGVGEIPTALLEYMSSINLLEPNTYKKLFCCTICGSTEFSVYPKCTKCGSTDLKKGQDDYTCSCGNIMKHQEILLDCSSCMQEVILDEAKIKSLVKYDLKDFTASELFYFVDLIEALKEFFLEKDFGITMFSEIKGDSGVKHQVDSLIINNNMPEQRLLLEFWFEKDKEITGEQILGFFAKSFDLQVEKKMLISFSKLSEEATQFSSFYNILVYNMNKGENINNLLSWFNAAI